MVCAIAFWAYVLQPYQAMGTTEDHLACLLSL